MTKSKTSGYMILLAVIAAMFLLGYMTRARAGQYVVERYTSGTAKIIELHDENDPPMVVYQEGRFLAQCDGFRVLSGEQRGGCVRARSENPQQLRR